MCVGRLLSAAAFFRRSEGTLAEQDGAGNTFQFFSSQFCKIFILLMLRSRGQRNSRQNLEPQGLTRKIFWNKELAPYFGPLFCVDFCKLFAFLWLRLDDR